MIIKKFSENYRPYGLRSVSKPIVSRAGNVGTAPVLLTEVFFRLQGSTDTFIELIIGP